MQGLLGYFRYSEEFVIQGFFGILLDYKRLSRAEPESQRLGYLQDGGELGVASGGQRLI